MPPPAGRVERPFPTPASVGVTGSGYTGRIIAPSLNPRLTRKGAQWGCSLPVYSTSVRDGNQLIRRSRRLNMAEAKTAVAHKPVWTDLSTSDAAAARDFYSKLFGWKVEINPDPQYGGYALAKVGGKDVAGIGPKQMAEAPTAWSVYIGTADAADTVKKAEAAGGNVVVPATLIGDQGIFAFIADPSGAVIG